MDSVRFQRVMSLFDQACGLDAAERAEFLAGECETTAIREEVEALLAQDDHGPVITSAGAGQRLLAAEIARFDPLEGDRTGPSPWPPVLAGQYRILRMVGEGGMGAVYEAEQARPRRIVALKAIHPGLASRDMLKRFEHEAHILGRLHHPGIAQIYEAGAADASVPDQAFFAMEFVDGPPLNEFAAAANLDVRQRLALMIKVCEAIQHAHQRGVIHRDLKPSNILVNHAGQPKILDFGVAACAQRNPLLTTMHTISGQMIGTLAYMSPEQVLADPNEIDIRADVYALGVITYQLLADRLPHELNNTPLPEAARIIREEAPMRLSSVNRLYRGDIETMVGKAMEKDKTRRYQSAAAMAEDLARYLDHQPIEARSPTALYQIRKFARRHTAIFSAIAAAFIILVASVIIVATFAYRATESRDQALQSQRAEALLREVAQEQSRQATRSAEDARRQAYRANIAAAAAALEMNDVAAARRRLRSVDAADQGQWEWRHYQSRLVDSVDEINLIAIKSR